MYPFYGFPMPVVPPLGYLVLAVIIFSIILPLLPKKRLRHRIVLNAMKRGDFADDEYFNSFFVFCWRFGVPLVIVVWAIVSVLASLSYEMWQFMVVPSFFLSIASFGVLVVSLGLNLDGEHDPFTKWVNSEYGSLAAYAEHIGLGERYREVYKVDSTAQPTDKQETSRI